MKQLLAFTGAGISRESGVPTFAEMGDVREKLSRSFFLSNPCAFYSLTAEMCRTALNAEPNDAHIALAQWGTPIITMNIDGLHSRAGSREIIEIHGNMSEVHCPDCSSRYPFLQAEKNFRCPVCGQILEHDIVLYGDSLPHFDEAAALVAASDALLVVGTSFSTSTADYIVSMAHRHGLPVTLINDRAAERVRAFLNEFYA